MNHCVYFMYAGRRLIYVGSSARMMRRIAQHKHRSAWFDQIDRIAVKRFPSRQEMLGYEKDAIKTKRPMENKQFTKATQPRQKKERPKTGTVVQALAITGVGGATHLAALLGITRQAVSRYHKVGRIPLEQWLKVKTIGRVGRHTNQTRHPTYYA